MSVPPDNNLIGGGFIQPPPDWLSAHQAGGSAPIQPAPGWLNSTLPGGNAFTQPMPDWLASVAASGQSTLPISQQTAPPAPSPREIESTDDLDALRTLPEIESPAAPDNDLFAELDSLRAESSQPPASPDSDVAFSNFAEPQPSLLDDQPASEMSWSSDNATPSPEATASNESLPEWMSAAPVESEVQAEPESAQPDELPDWLKGASAAEPIAESKPAAEPEAAPDWLSAAPADLAPSPVGEEEKSDELPDWLKGTSTAEPVAESKPAAEPEATPDWLSATPIDSSPAPAPKEEEDQSIPDWVTGDAPPPPIPEIPADAPEIPDFLKSPPELYSEKEPEPAAAEIVPPAADLPDFLQSQQSEPTAPAPPPAAAASAAPASDAPDWLNEMAGTPAPPPAAPAPAAPAADAPDWLNEMAGTPAPPPAAPAPAVPASDAPDWLNEMAGTPAPPPAAAAPAAPAADAPDWLNEMAGTPAPPPAVPAPAAPAESPMSADWLDALAAPAPASPTPSTPSQSADDMLGLLDGLDLGTGIDMPVQGMAASSEDLLGLTDDLSLAAPAEKVVSEESENLDLAATLAEGDMPEWMRELSPAGRPGSIGEPVTTSPELMSQIGDLRFDKIFSGESKAGGPEKVGALKDVVNTLRSELIFAGISLKPGDVLLDQPVTTDQQKRIGLIEQILKVEAEGVSIAREREGLPLTRWLVSLLLIAAVVAPMFVSLPLPLDSASSPDVLSAHDALAALPENASVLVAFEYEPDSSAELQPLALALISDLATRTDVQIYTISTHLAGAAMADFVFDELVSASSSDGQTSGQIEQGDRPTSQSPVIAASTWTNLGYLPGGPSGVTALTSGGPEGAPSSFAQDVYGHSTGLGNASLNSLKPAVIIVLASRASDVRMWVEQAGKPTGIPIIAATSQSASSMAAPYRQSGQLLAHLLGTADAARYATLTKIPSAAEGLLNMQVIGSLVAILLIVIGSIVYGLRALRERQR